MQLLIPKNLEALQDTAASHPLLKQTSNHERRAQDLQIDAVSYGVTGTSKNADRF
jgi:hypothetical protein